MKQKIKRKGKGRALSRLGPIWSAHFPQSLSRGPFSYLPTRNGSVSGTAGPLVSGRPRFRAYYGRASSCLVGPADRASAPHGLARAVDHRRVDPPCQRSLPQRNRTARDCRRAQRNVAKISLSAQAWTSGVK
jgi:hypothetical protein